MKLKSKLRKLMITTGLILAFGLLATGCSAKEAVPTESTAVETVAETEDPFSLGGVDVKVETDAPKVDIIAEENGAYVGTTPTGETQYAFDKYGPLGKEVWDSIALQWTTRSLDTESDLRTLMDATYGPLSTKEDLTQDILALNRDPAQQNSVSANAQGNGTPTESTKSANTETKAANTKPTETKAQPKETQPAPTQAPTPAPTPTPAPQPTEALAPTQSNTANNGLIPGTNIPSTGDPAIDDILKGNYENVHQGDVDKIAENAPKEYEDQGKGLDWN